MQVHDECVVEKHQDKVYKPEIWIYTILRKNGGKGDVLYKGFNDRELVRVSKEVGLVKQLGSD